MGRHEGCPDSIPGGPSRQFLMVALPQAAAGSLDLLPFLKLCEEKCGQHIAHDVTAAEVDPAIFVHLAAKKARAVGALLADDLGAFDEPRVVDYERATLAAGDV